MERGEGFMWLAKRKCKYAIISIIPIFFVSLHFLFAGPLTPAEGDRTLNINTFMGLGDGPRGCGKVNENNKNK